jgi:hypothetical protein
MSEMVEPKSAGAGKCLGHALNAKAAAKGRVEMKENPAYKWVKMQASKSPVLKKSAKSIKKGGRNLPSASGADEMAAQGQA